MSVRTTKATRRTRRLGAAAAALTLGLTAGGCVRWQSALVSVNAAGTAAGGGPSSAPVLSPDGTTVAFVSGAPDLVAGDGNGLEDVFVRDLASGTTTLVSATGDGTGSGNGASSQPAFSPDGELVVFTSFASDLGPADGNGPTVRDVYVRDLAAGTTTLVSHDAAGTGSGNGESHDPQFSPDGSRVGFVSSANNLGPPDTGPTMIANDLYLRDLTTDGIELVTYDAEGTGAVRLGFMQGFSFSPDGTTIAFGNLAPGFHPLAPTGGQIYLRDLAAGATDLVSINPAGTAGGVRDSTRPVFSPDGRRIAFQSAANDLGPTDTSVCWENPQSTSVCHDVYVRDLVAGTTSLVSVNAAGTNSGRGGSREPVFSPDGRSIAFTSSAGDLVAGDASTCPTPSGSFFAPCRDVFLRDLVAGTTTLVSVPAGAPGGGPAVPSWAPAFSPDGRSLAFTSQATGFGPRDTNGADDVYVRDLRAGRTSLLSANAAGDDAGDGPSGPGFSWGPDGRRIAFASQAADLAAAGGVPDGNGVADIYLGTHRPARPPSDG
jgi:Tol biopolymer transport system component